MKRKGPPEESGEKVPIWVISFADMITLLLSFFVMLQTMAKTRDATLLRVGQDSFRRAVAGMGIPDLLFGRQEAVKLDYRKIKYPTESDENKSTGRLIDAEGDRLRQMFQDLQQMMEARTADEPHEMAAVFATPLKFSGAGSDLDDAACRAIKTLAADLAHRNGGRIYMVGLAADQPSRARQWFVSAKRAIAVENALRETLANGSTQWEMYSWGAGGGGRWCDSLGISAGDTHIAIAVIGKTDEK